MEADPDPSGCITAILLQSEALFASPGSFVVILITALLFVVFSILISGSEYAFRIAAGMAAKTNGDGAEYAESKIVSGLLQNPHRLAVALAAAKLTLHTVSYTLLLVGVLGFFGTQSVIGWIITGVGIIFIFLVTNKPFGRMLAAGREVRTANFTASLISGAFFLFYPFTAPLVALRRRVLKRFSDDYTKVSPEELSRALEHAEDTDEQEKEILRGVVNFGTISVKQIMRSRPDIFAADIDTSFHELMDKINKCGYSRIPVYKESIDSVKGIIYIKDLLPFIDEEEDFKWQQLLRKSYFVPESKKINGLLKDFQQMRVHMAIVVDEYGGTAGLITLEDIVEEIVGEISDEPGEDEELYHQLDENTWLFEGKTSLNDFSKLLNSQSLVIEEVKGESESLGGLLTEQFARLPETGEQFTVGQLTFTVMAVDKKRIKKVKVEIGGDETNL